MIKKEVIIGDCRLLLGDCLEIMPTLEKVDAVVTDPPYGIKYAPGKPSKARMNSAYVGGEFVSGASMIIGDDKPFDPSILWGCADNHIIWGANNFCSRLKDTNGWLVWDKTRGGTTNNGFIKSECELAWTSFLRRTKIISHLWDGVKRDSEVAEGVLPPTQKPVKVMEWCLKHLPEETQTILDPFAGSGTTGVACVKLGRKFIGIELNERYFDIACKRIEEAYKQPDLFIETPTKPVQEKLI